MPHPFPSLRRDTVIGLALAFAAFAVYLITLSRSIGPEDAGELAAAVHTLGITHPTGYPLFSLLGKAFSLLPIGGMRVIVKLNLMGAVACAAAVFVFYRLFLMMLRPSGPRPRSARKDKGPDDGDPSVADRIGAAAGALALAFSGVMWTNAAIVEVYALHFLFLGLVTLLFLRAVRAPHDADAAQGRWWLLFAYVLGLSFSNHLMTSLLAPAFLWMFFSTRGFGAAAWRMVAQAVPPFLLGLTPYLYLPVRASTGPAMPWGDPVTWERFRLHVTGFQYGEKMFSSFGVAWTKFWRFWFELPGEFGHVPALVSAAGLVVLWRANRKIALFTLAIFVVGVFYEINYDFDDPNFRINAHAMVAFWAAAGAAAIAARLLRDGSRRLPLTLAVAAVIPLAPLALSYAERNERDNHAVEDYARNVLENLAPGAVIVTGTRVEFSFPAWYLQKVEGVRPDVIVADYNLLGLSWHMRQTLQERPAQAEELRDAMGIRMSQLRADIPRLMRSRSRAEMDDTPEHMIVVRSFLDVFAAHAPVYVIGFVPEDVTGGYYDLPEGLARRLHVDLPEQVATHAFAFRPLPEGRKRYIADIRETYIEAYHNQALLRLMVFEDTLGAARLAARLLELQPENTWARVLVNAAPAAQGPASPGRTPPRPLP